MDALLRNRILNRLSQPREEGAKLLRRLEVQLAFAEAFACLGDPSWNNLVREAKAAAEPLAAEGGLDELARAVEQAEQILAPLGEAAKAYTVHCVGHGHIDMNWMWSWPETVAATHDTFASVLNLMDQVPGVTYSQSQASVYALIEKHHPAMFRQIQERVKEGRWEVAAAHWVEGDKNLAHGEALARHLLYTRRYFAEKFGLSPADVPIDWEPDTFGHARTLPGILARGGVTRYYCCRPGGGQEQDKVGDPRPALFWWQGPDGSRVLVNRETTWYNSYVHIGENFAQALVPFARETGLHHWLNVFGIGNHGGGPTLAEVRYIQEAMTWPIYPKVEFSTVCRYFDSIEPELPADLPVLDHELNYEFTGCYTSQSAIKRANRFGENYCLEAEPLSLVAAALNGEEPRRESLREAWINVLFNQFHDILPGSGVVHTRNHATALFQETAAMTGAIKKEAAKALARSVDTASLLPPGAQPGDTRPYEAGAGAGAMLSGYSSGVSALGPVRPVIIWNPCDFERTEMVQVDLYDLPVDPLYLVALDSQGSEQPTVFISRGRAWDHQKAAIAFAATVPPLGYAVYVIKEGDPSLAASLVEPLGQAQFKTPTLEMAFDRGGSGLASLKDLRTGAVLKGVGSIRKTQERPTGMSAWVLGAEPEPSQPLLSDGCHVRHVWRQPGPQAGSTQAPAYLVEQIMPVPGTKSSAVLRCLVHGLAPRVDFELDLDWREIGDSKVGVPGIEVAFGGFPGDTALYQTPFGSVERPANGWEVPSLQFVHGFDGFGATVVQDSKYGHRRRGDELSFRVVRSSYEPDPTPEVGQQTVRFSIILHQEAPSKLELARLGAAVNHPLMVIPAPIQSGSLPAALSLASVEGEGVGLTSLKPGEEGGIVLRLVEHEGRESKARVTLNGLLAKGLAKAESVDLMENPDGGSAAWDGEVLEVVVPAYGIRSIRLS